VVGAGNSAADIAVDVSRVAAHTTLSMREGRYVVPKLVFGRPVDTVHAFWRRRVPRPLLQRALRWYLRLTVGRWADYGLPVPCHAPLDKPPTLNSGLLEALRHGRLVARPGVARYDGSTVVFVDGTREEFDAVVMGTGFRTSFPFLPEQVVAAPPLPYLNMMHPAVPNLFFIGLFQPIGCIWRLADYQARIAARRMRSASGAPPVGSPVDRTVHSGINVDYATFHRQLVRELARTC
jgi:cation diffusion facilitator CzcD-associated flavoprotein CzcO